MERGHIHRARVEQDHVRQHRRQGLVQVDDVEGLPQQHLLDRAVERDIEGQPHPRLVAGDRDRPPNAVEIGPDLEAAFRGARRNDRDLMTKAVQLGLQMKSLKEKNNLQYIN